MELTSPPPRLALLVLAAATTAVAVLAGLAATGAPPPRPVPAAAPARDPLAVLHAWDVRRAEAWARGDLQALRDLYAPGSVAGRRDAAMLRAWTERGLRVRGMRMQVLAADVRARSRHRLTIAVTDRLATAVAVGGGTRVSLPRDVASTRTIVLTRAAGEWRVASVRDGGQPAR